VRRREKITLNDATLIEVLRNRPYQVPYVLVYEAEFYDKKTGERRVVSVDNWQEDAKIVAVKEVIEENGGAITTRKISLVVGEGEVAPRPAEEFRDYLLSLGKWAKKEKSKILTLFEYLTESRKNDKNSRKRVQVEHQ
jgi:hypothetical protein